MTALTIAGFDPSTGAGITADLQVFAAHGIFGTSAITALTVQSTVGVSRTESVSGHLLRDTLRTLEDDLPPDGIKIGMLSNATVVREVVRHLRSVPQRTVVLDPVIRSSSGAALLDEEGLRMLREELIPLVTVVTPNAAELELLTGCSYSERESQRAAAEALSEESGCAVIVTGGDGEQPIDLVYGEKTWTVLTGEHIESNATHGTGCAFSSAVLCGLLRGDTVAKAAADAKKFVEQAIRSATPRGRGKGPMNLLWPISGHSSDR